MWKRKYKKGRIKKISKWNVHRFNCLLLLDEAGNWINSPLRIFGFGLLNNMLTVSIANSIVHFFFLSVFLISFLRCSLLMISLFHWIFIKTHFFCSENGSILLAISNYRNQTSLRLQYSIRCHRESRILFAINLFDRDISVVHLCQI